MKAKYIFSCETGAITTETVFYTVYIGNSAYGQRLLQRCQALTFSTNYFFAKADAKTSEFLLNVAQSLYPGVTIAHSEGVPSRNIFAELLRHVMPT